MKKYVLYEAIIGAYDQILQPLVIDDRFDYVLFSDSIKETKVGVWQIRQLPYDKGTNKLKSGYAKCNVEHLLGDYEASLWIDGNIQIATQYVYDRFIELVEDGVEWASIKHPSQQCTYDEICTIVELRWVLDSQVVDWYASLKKQNFPENWGLYETNVLFRKHSANIFKVCRIWWETLLLNIRRDQFSVMYALWRVMPKMTDYLANGECPRLESKNFNYVLHNPHKRVQKLGFHEMMRYRIIRTQYPNNIRKGYHEMFDWTSRFKCPKTALLLWELIFSLRYAPMMVMNSIKNRR